MLDSLSLSIVVMNVTFYYWLSLLFHFFLYRFLRLKVCSLYIVIYSFTSLSFVHRYRFFCGIVVVRIFCNLNVLMWLIY